jgi:glycosyltransferase involved in cell wall biosynthesis
MGRDAVDLRISCVVPVHNGERFLEEALATIFSQTLAPDEVIVVDDGSTDGTAAVAARHGDAIRYLNQSQAGPAAARNRGIAAARGELIAFLDADDRWHREKLARQAARFRGRPELEISLTHIRSFWIADLAHEQERLRDHPLARPMPGYTAQTLVARRSGFDRIGVFDPAMRHKDVVDWLIRAARMQAVMEVLPDVLVERRIHQANLSRQRRGEDVEELFQLAKLVLDQRRGADEIWTR